MVNLLGCTNSRAPTGHLCPADDSSTARKWRRTAPDTFIKTIDVREPAPSRELLNRALSDQGAAQAQCGRRRVSSSVRAMRWPSADWATSRRGAERRVREHAGLVLDQLDAAVEGAVLDHLEGDVRIAVVDAFCARGPSDHREHPDPETVDESGP